MLDAEVLVLPIIGFVLVMGSVIALTSFGGRWPKLVLLMMFIAFTAYMSVILVRLGVIDLKPWIPGIS